MTASCQIDFYVLSSPGLDAGHMACRLALMSWERGHRTTIVTETGESARQLDALMWESPAMRFLPHELATGSEPGAAAVVIALMDGLPRNSVGECDVLINLSPQAVQEPERFKRLLEIVPQEKEARAASRQKYRFYQDMGIEPGAHEISK